MNNRQAAAEYRARVKQIPQPTCAHDCPCWTAPAIEAAAERACADAADEEWMRRETKRTLRRLGT